MERDLTSGLTYVPARYANITVSESENRPSFFKRTLGRYAARIISSKLIQTKLDKWKKKKRVKEERKKYIRSKTRGESLI